MVLNINAHWVSARILDSFPYRYWQKLLLPSPFAEYRERGEKALTRELKAESIKEHLLKWRYCFCQFYLTGLTSWPHQGQAIAWPHQDTQKCWIVSFRLSIHFPAVILQCGKVLKPLQTVLWPIYLTCYCYCLKNCILYEYYDSYMKKIIIIWTHNNLILDITEWEHTF